eukprot:gb/GEZN01007622.1/.p1 GENE.gb/GEZN01007622.1/~~gb/GEZN01007622.1/.p1  ORF type:complete len:467 (+),score=58.56 gb/GEZN01007622.1/:58-1401(+)
METISAGISSVSSQPSCESCECVIWLPCVVPHPSSSPSPSSPSSDTFIITGDIRAQWLRDSTNQVLPYMLCARKDPTLRDMLCGLIHRQAHDILHNPYANAFNFGEQGEGHSDDITTPPMSPHVYEMKYELDSLAAALKLAYAYWNATADITCFQGEWLSSIGMILTTMETMQKPTSEDYNDPPYSFARSTTIATDTLPYQARGSPVKYTGLVKSMFRPSDDASTFGFHIPANAMAAVELRHVATMLSLPTGPTSNPSLAQRAIKLSEMIEEALQEFGIVTRKGKGQQQQDQRVYAYEADGFGSSALLDDANIPSLLSLPYLNYLPKSDKTYHNTRRFILSKENPYFFKGSVAQGIGGPHVGYGMIWHMSLIMQALTSDSDSEISQILNTLASTTGGTGFMHESFSMHNASVYTRSWFAWANGLFGELILTLVRERPWLLFNETETS